MVKKEWDVYPYEVTDLSGNDALVIAPHPDDESIGCGGSLIRHIKAGSRVKVIFLTYGDKGDYDGRYGKDYIKIRMKSARKALNVLGVTDYEFWGYSDREFHLSVQDARIRLSRTIEAFHPALIYAPSPFEVHPDHKGAFDIIWHIREQYDIKLALYEVLIPLHPNILVDITSEMRRKKRAIKSYFTEVYYNDYVAKVMGLNRFRTATLPKHIAAKNITYAEAFILLEHGIHSTDATPLKLISAILK
jgi:LmbE family N-acetylglucosaminyl deacetylase